ncbi:MAG: sugar phosphate isomerase/epimerase family protein [Anaerolineae bacterium]|jgi:sugar phosphate isomerase/epimerase|nr:sugar phosphate isomerase/epimerase family protein [Anaerolineae bacterium]
MTEAIFIPSGFADEASGDFAQQIKAHQQLGWEYLDIRTIEGVKAEDLSIEKHQVLKRMLNDAGMQVSSIGSAMGKVPIDSVSFDNDIRTLDRLCKLATAVGARYIRVMAYEQAGDSPELWRDKAVLRLRKLGNYARIHGVMLVLENCVGYPQDGDKMVEFLELCNCDNVRCAFDPGNAAGHGVDTWEMYTKVRPYIEYFHLKDTAYDGSQHFPGEGDAQIEKILTALWESDYQGFLSIEPHVASTDHLASDSQLSQWDSYLKYGQMANDLYEKVQGK